MNVNIKRLSADATTPTYAHSTDACFDLYAAEDGISAYGPRVRDSGRIRNADQASFGHYAEDEPSRSTRNGR